MYMETHLLWKIIITGITSSVVAEYELTTSNRAATSEVEATEISISMLARV
jgi:hypothetical protein